MKSHLASRSRGFTIIEVMISIFIFALILTAIYSTWFGIMKGTRSGLRAAAEVQRSRIAIRAIEDAFNTLVMFQENMKHYYFYADTSGDLASVSMVSRLPATFPGVARYGDIVVRRVSFYTEPGTNGMAQLIMSQAPMLLKTNDTDAEGYTLPLARDVSMFVLEFFDDRKKEWVGEWLSTNTIPKLVRVTLGLGKQTMSSDPADITTKIIAIPSMAVGGVQRTMNPNNPGENFQGTGVGQGGMQGPGGGPYPGGGVGGGAFPGGAGGGVYPGGAGGGMGPGGKPGGSRFGGGQPGGDRPRGR